MHTDTITAIATAAGAGGVGIVRISGPDAFLVADRLLSRRRAASSTADFAGHTLHRAVVRDPRTGETVDDALVAVFHAPRSLTGENVVEIQGHGGTVTPGRVLEAVLCAGARLARPGEFSERAFLNGKMDLAQAEAVADLVGAQTVAAQRAARRQVSGDLSRVVQSSADAIKSALAQIEASIDFSEEVGEPLPAEVDAPLAWAETGIRGLLATAAYGRRLRDGLTLVLAGRPNVGKSSLLNALSGTDRAIVTPVPGTTRDVVEEALNLHGLPVRALDTAGIRETDDPVERIGVERTRRAVSDEADVVVAVLDAAQGMTTDDRTFLLSLAEADRSVVIAVNKADTVSPTPALDAAAEAFPRFPAVAVSAVTGQGLDALATAIVHTITESGTMNAVDSVVVTSARHDAALRACLASLQTARETLARNLPLELIAVDAHGALHALGEITGETVREEIIAGIFARFCLGK